ncbi:MAG: DUF3592 domain-containing protein [Desulfobulbaceae bacterium]|nr:DUF3592 domain-containing protein [Desulfobulbaceae bacterium]
MERPAICFSASQPPCPGIVVEQWEKTGSKFSTFYYPVVEFKTANGEKVKFTGSAGNAGGPQLPTGSRVEVLYDPANPSQAWIMSFVQYWLGPAGVTAMGLMGMLGSIYAFLKTGPE